MIYFVLNKSDTNLVVNPGQNEGGMTTVETGQSNQNQIWTWPRTNRGIFLSKI